MITYEEYFVPQVAMMHAWVAFFWYHEGGKDFNRVIIDCAPPVRERLS